MQFQQFITGRREFYNEEELKRHIVNSSYYLPDRENPEDAITMIFFQTSKQHTWLVATKIRLYCILDDIRKPEPHINWSMSRDDIFSGNDLSLSITAMDHGPGTGLIGFGSKHKRWLFSKNLFIDKNIEDRVKDFLRQAMM